MTSIAAGHIWSSQNSGTAVVVEDVLAADDYDEVFDLADRTGVDLSGLDEIDEMKERLLMHLRRDGNGNDKTSIINSTLDCHRDDEAKRQKLNETLMKCQSKLSEFVIPEQTGRRRGSHAIEDLLKVEGTARNFELDFRDRIKYIQSGDCVIVVSGETSAGKSRTLNLLLGMNILPVHHCSCTSVITRIQYGKTYGASILFRDGTSRDFSDQNKMEEDLWESIYVKDQDGRDLVTSIKEVVIRIPCNILKCGIVFVDSPGIGENDAMDSIIAEFVEENEIMGFMYVIKTDNAGGVDEDRLLALIKLVLEKQKKKSAEGMSPFDPQCAVFVCNRWDLIKQDPQRIYDNAFKKLSQCWPGLEEKQVICLSTTRAEVEIAINPDYITSQFKGLLESIKDIFIRAIQSRVQATYRWLERLLIRSVHHLKTLVKGLDSSEKNLEDHMKVIYEKLQTLKERSSNVLTELKLRVSEDYRCLCDDFRVYLQTPRSRISITQWIESEVIEFEDNIPWEIMKAEIDEMICRRITNHLIEWDKDSDRVKSIQDMIVNEMKLQLRFLKNEVDQIESEVEESQPELSPVSPDFSTSYLSTSRRLTFSNINTFTLPGNTDLALPTKLASRLTTPVSSMMKRASKLFGNDDKKVQEYRTRPTKVMKHRAEKLLKALIQPQKDDVLETYIHALMNRPTLYLQYIEENIPGFISSNENVLDHVAACRVDAKESRDLYERMMEALELLKHGLLQYGHGYIFVDDFMHDEIRLKEESDSDSTKSASSFRVSDIILNSSSCKEANRRTLPRGLWTALQNASVHREEKETPITIRVYLPSAGVEHTFPEVSKLRFLQDFNVAEFMGIHHGDTPTPAFVYKNHLKSVKRYLRSTLSFVPEEVTRIVKQTVSGLEYLHRKKMVHMELTINTVTVDPDGNVKLTGGCLPRLAVFPIDKEKVEVGDFVYLSPSVLNGELYITCSDVYSLGLLLMETVLNVEVFSDQRKWPLDRFSEKVDPRTMLEMDAKFEESGMSKETSDVIRECLAVSREDRPSLSSIMPRLTHVTNDVIVPNKRATRSKIVKGRRFSNTGFRN